MGIQGLTKMASKIGGAIGDKSPTILVGLSVAGLFTTTVLAVKATPKAMRVIDNAEKEELAINDDFKCFDKIGIIKRTWKCYIPTAVMASATVVCIVYANSINLRRNAALAGAYSLTEKALKEYQSKVVEQIGENKERDIRHGMHKDKVDKNPVSKNEVIITGNGETLCYDQLSGRYFKSDLATINGVINDINKRLMNENFIYLSEIYTELGMEGTKLGDLMGFYIDDGLIETDFSSQIAEDGRPCLVLDFETQPRYYKRDY